jgi:MerR family transcriptional regulator/heat shock protein HspR
METIRDNADDPVISIGILAERVGLSVSTVRKYEIEGLIIAHRTASGRRMFSHEDIDRVRAIQHMIRDVGLNVEGIRRMQALLPCWDIFPCDEEKRKDCLAFREATRPCWVVKCPKSSTKDDNACRECLIYRLGSLCTEDIKHLLHDKCYTQDVGAAIKELIKLKRR